MQYGVAISEVMHFSNLFKYTSRTHYSDRPYCQSDPGMRQRDLQGGLKNNDQARLEQQLTIRQRLRENDKCDKIVVDLAEDLARSLDYAANVGQFARLPQLKKTLEQLRPLVEDTTNFILRYSNRSRSGAYFRK